MLSQVYDLIEGNSARSRDWSNYLTTVNHDVVLIRPIPRGKLSISEIEKLRGISELFNDQSELYIWEVIHSCEEWLNLIS